VTAATEGTITTLVTAGRLTVTDQPPHPTLGQQVAMGDTGALFLHITYATAQQWIAELSTIKPNETSN